MFRSSVSQWLDFSSLMLAVRCCADREDWKPGTISSMHLCTISRGGVAVRYDSTSVQQACRCPFPVLSQRRKNNAPDADALCDVLRVTGRHCIRFQDVKHRDWQKSG